MLKLANYFKKLKNFEILLFIQKKKIILKSLDELDGKEETQIKSFEDFFFKF